MLIRSMARCPTCDKTIPKEEAVNYRGCKVCYGVKAAVQQARQDESQRSQFAVADLTRASEDAYFNSPSLLDKIMAQGGLMASRSGPESRARDWAIKFNNSPLRSLGQSTAQAQQAQNALTQQQLSSDAAQMDRALQRWWADRQSEEARKDPSQPERRGAEVVPLKTKRKFRI